MRDKTTNMETGGAQRDSTGRFVAGHVPILPYSSPRNSVARIRMSFLNAFEEIGGEKELVRWVLESKQNKREFYKMILSLLPAKDIGLDPEKNNRILVIINENTTQGLAKEICVEPKEVPGDVCGVGDGEIVVSNLAGDVV